MALLRGETRVNEHHLDARRLAAGTLPSPPGSFGQTELHVFALATGSGPPTS